MNIKPTNLKASQPTSLYLGGILTQQSLSRPEVKTIFTYLPTTKLIHIENKSSGFIRDIFNSTLGILNNYLGRKIESQAIANLSKIIQLELKQTSELNIVVHSQGSIILGNYLAKLPLAQIKKIKVTTLGAANHLWPKDLTVEAIINQHDLIAKTAFELNHLFYSFISEPYQKFRYLLFNSTRENKINIPSIVNNKQLQSLKNHYLQNY